MDGTGVDLLDQRGMTRPGSRMPLAESFIGMVVRAGQPKPDISSVEAMRKTLLAAKSIAYSDSSSGAYLSTIGFKKLGVADEIVGKTRKVRGPPSGEPVAAVVARGEAEVGFQQVSELIHVPGVDFVGTVPSDIQPPTLFVGALPKNSQQPDLAVALLRFLSSAEAAGVITKAGLKPLAAR
jgi:molybdate transport system substrate-binding protein